MTEFRTYGRGRSVAEGLEIPGWGEIAKGLMRPLVIEAVGEGVDGLVALDGSIDPRSLRRQDEEGEPLVGDIVRDH